MALTTVRSTGIGSLPAISGANLTSLNASNISSGTLNSARFSGGKVLQVVENRLTTVLSTTSTSWVATTGLNASITPSSSSNKVLILLNATLSSGNHGHIRLSRDGGSNFIGNGAQSGSRSGVNFYANVDANSARPQSCTIFDSPSTTSALTYQAYWRVYGGTTYLNRTQNDNDSAYGSRGVSSITLLEVEG